MSIVYILIIFTNLVSSEQRKRVAMEQTRILHELFELRVNNHPENVAIRYKNTTVTYEQLNQKANQLAHYLRKQGVTPEGQVAVCMERSVDFLIAILAVLKAGGAYIPLDPTHPNERLLNILSQGETSFVITTYPLQEKFHIYQGALIHLEQEDIQKEDTLNPESVTKAHHLAYVIYTSGSTGTPKGVLIEHQSVVNYAHWFADYCRCTLTDKIDCSSNPAFDMAVTSTIVPLALGLTVVLCDDLVKKDPKKYLQYLAKNQINLIKLTPSYFKILASEAKNSFIELPHLKKIILGGEILARTDCKSWLDLYPQQQLFNEYGPTETTVAITCFQVNKNNVEELPETIPIGFLAPQLSGYIIDANGKRLPDGEVGELHLGGICLARGYLNNPELTQKQFIKDPFHSDPKARMYNTGDLCQLLPSGAIQCLGRLDQQIKIRGFRIELEEIEYCLATHPALKNTAVIAADKYSREKQLIAYYTLKYEYLEVNDQDLRHYLKRYLPDYMIPQSFVRMDAFPLNANEKLDRLALPVPVTAVSQNYIAPHTELEKTLASIWIEELGISSIGLDDDFFELGGHSLSAARVISTINHTLDKELYVHEFFKNPTIAGLVTLAQEPKSISPKEQTPVKSGKETSLPLSDFQLMLWLADIFEPKAKKLNIVARKRIIGTLCPKKLRVALEALIADHEVLSYQVSKFHPAQYVQKKSQLNLTQRDVTALSEEETEHLLQQSVEELMNFYPWPRQYFQLAMRVFFLKDGNTEIQVGLPHLIADDLSPNILLSELSQLYLQNDEVEQSAIPNRSYKNYIIEEQNHIKNNLKRDIEFWENYLSDTHLFTIPDQYIVKQNSNSNFNYSTYLEIPEYHLDNLKNYCAKKHLSLVDGLSAALLLALSERAGDSSRTVCINRVKSTRDKRDYDKSLGCFLRVEPIKVTLNSNATFKTLSEELHESVINTHLYQGCPNLVKLASIKTFRRSKKRIKTHLLKFFLWFYMGLLRTKLNRTVLEFASRLNAIKGNHFLINLNVQNSFIGSPLNQDKSLFGMKTEEVYEYPYDQLKIDNVFDVCFLRKHDSNTPFVVISANLEPAYREEIGQIMIAMMGAAVADEQSSTQYESSVP